MVLKKIAAIVAALIAVGTQTARSEQAQSIYHTATWQFAGICDGTDQVYRWKISGQTQPDGWKILPWEKAEITIRSVELTKVTGGPNMWFMAGNGYIADVMVFMGKSKDHVLHDFPEGTGMPFPSSINPPGRGYLDLHGGCTGGDPVIIFYTIGYTLHPEHPIELFD